MWMSLLQILALQSILQTALYYLDVRLGIWTDVLSLASAIGIVSIFKFTTHATPVKRDEKTSLVWTLLALLPALAAAAFILWHAHKAAALEPILSPWSRFPRGTLAAVAILMMSAWLSAWRACSTALTAALTALTLGLIGGLTIVVYPLGFGFDGFLHRASEQVLLATGTLNPKPPYYIGQYVLVTWLARWTHLSLRWIDLALLPTMLLLVPWIVLLAWPRLPERRWLPVALLLLFPLAPFIATTPQSLAYLLGVFGVLLALAAEEYIISPWLSFILVGWSLLIHPLAGLPFCGAVFLVWWNARLQRLSRPSLTSPVVWIALLVTIGAVPLAFLINGLRSSTQIIWNLPSLVSLGRDLTGLFLLPRTHVVLWADWAALISFIFPWVLGATAIVSPFQAHRKQSSLYLLVLLGIGLILAGWLMKAAGDFTFLISYERNNYAERLFIIGQLLWLIAALPGLASWLPRLLKRPALSLTIILLILAGWFAAQTYNALPHHDAAHTEHGWSVGRADFDAVRWIDQDAHGQPYTVLANQSVSAAAIEAFGFKRYAGDIFYYPIPTGGPLYQIYLAAVGTHPDRATIERAGELGQSSLVYVVVNKYWWEAERVEETLANLSDATVKLDADQIEVYRFDLTKDKKR